MMEIKENTILFTDWSGTKCELADTRLVNEPTIWLGVLDADPRIRASIVMAEGIGYVKYPLHEEVQLTTRMHLSRQNVVDLWPHLLRFIETGSIEP